MHACAAAGAGFLIAVLWFDLMFDVQTRKYSADPLPAEVLSSISAYYRRVTTEARPMNQLIAAVMVLTLLAIAAEIVQSKGQSGIAYLSLIVANYAILLALMRTVPNAMRLGRAIDSPGEQSRLAHAIYRDHIYCLAAIFVLLVLQLTAQL
jgi:hypothetical protein